MKKKYWYEGVVFLVFIYLFFVQIQAIWPFTIDDMFISLRYAKNWALGNGLLWNPSALPVEGYSNFSFVVLGAVAILLHLNPVFFLKFIGVVGLFFTTYFIYGISRFWFERTYAYLPCMILLLYKGQIIWAVSGLETTLYEALICGAIFYSFKGLGFQAFPLMPEAYKKSYLFLAGLLLALAGMTRPETPVLMGLFFILIIWHTFQTKKPCWGSLIYFIFPIVFIYIPYFFWRWHYYGLFFPNAIYCKGFISNNFLLDLNFLEVAWPFILLALYAFIRKRDIRYYFLALPSLLYLGMLFGADPIVAFDNRLFLPAFILLLPLAWVGIAQLLPVEPENPSFVFGMFVASIYLCFLIPKASLAEYGLFKQGPLEGEELRTGVVTWLDAHTKAKDFVVLADAGFIPYSLEKLQFIDSYCLNNRSMSQSALTNRYKRFCHSILDQKPEIVILTSLSKGGELVYTPADLCLKELLNRQNNYNLTRVFTSKGNDSNYRYELFTQG